MTGRHPCGGANRREFLASAAALGLSATIVSAQEPKGVAASKKPMLGVPGPYPGVVIEARNPAMVREGKKDRAAVKATLDRGLVTLVGATDPTEAWRSFFEPGDVVGIKMNPVGDPLANSSAELMLSVIDGLKSAGVKARDIVVFERYKEEFFKAKMHEAVPEGVAWGGLSPVYDNSQLEIKFPGDDPIGGYDRDEFVSLDLVHHGHDPKDDRNFRSHLGLLVTKRVNKLVLLPVLKDHGSAGVTGALKNMSHGLVNNVARSHSTPSTNACNQFIPQVVNHPILRKKCVLQILDGIIGVYQGGPFAYAKDAAWTWENNALYLATDPVAMDKVEWGIIDAKRKEKGLAPVGAVGKLARDAEREGFDVRQPQHIPLAANLGLGMFDKIDHRVINVG